MPSLSTLPLPPGYQKCAGHDEITLASHSLIGQLSDRVLRDGHTFAKSVLCMHVVLRSCSLGRFILPTNYDKDRKEDLIARP